jgi:hypothetical protein
MIGDGIEHAQDPLSPAFLVSHESFSAGEAPSYRPTVPSVIRFEGSVPNKYVDNSIADRCADYEGDIVNIM